jgi:hypothetical protein
LEWARIANPRDQGLVGLGFGIIGTAGHIGIDLHLYYRTGDVTYLNAALTRGAFYGATFGIGKMFQLGGRLVDNFIGQFLAFTVDNGLKPEFIKTKY